MLRSLSLALTMLILAALPCTGVAGQVRVAVAANFAEPAQDLATAFRIRTGDTVVLSPGSSGQLYVQIAHGAPYEVFLSADVDQPARAEINGLSVKGTRFTYGTGRLVLYSTRSGLVMDKGAVLGAGDFNKLAIADPATAPYGRAAVETLRKIGLYDRVSPKLVTGTSITQAFQFVETGAADLGFVALSQVIRKPGGSRWLVPVSHHAPVAQQAVLLKRGDSNPAARRFLAFLKSREARSIISSYGYEVP
ncbi:MAG: molybdate ABC transporter substrate-binding protein [Alphaproteobacteria bacterium PA2]|nr:MAG: molybdate ABC transporter substrate-binding protein [Alphaproteobacteria bacterium PA2]